MYIRPMFIGAAFGNAKSFAALERIRINLFVLLPGHNGVVQRLHLQLRVQRGDALLDQLAAVEVHRVRGLVVDAPPQLLEPGDWSCGRWKSSPDAWRPARPINTITRIEILNFRADVLRRPGPAGKPHLSPRTVNHIMGSLRTLMREASDEFRIPNPYAGIKAAYRAIS